MEDTNEVLRARLELYAVVHEMRGEEEWSEENIAASLYLFGCLAREKAGDAHSMEVLTGLDSSRCAIFDQRMSENGMVPAELLTLYEGHPDGIEATLDTLVLLGMMRRGINTDGEITYRNTPEGIAYVEAQLLPKGGA